MAKAEELKKKKAAERAAEEDVETLAAIDEGVDDAKAGRTVPLEEVRKRLPQWNTAFSLRKKR
jgi:predicted transcriptional regulator